MRSLRITCAFYWHLDLRCRWPLRTRFGFGRRNHAPPPTSSRVCPTRVPSSCTWTTNSLVADAPRLRLQEEGRSEEHTSELQSHLNLVCRLLLEKKKRTEFHPALLALGLKT